jgi:curved DNA-binding protein CbpA
MTDHYEVLGVERTASDLEIQAAFDERLTAAKAKRRRTSDLHAAIAVLGDPTLRKAFDLARLGEAAGSKLVHAKAVTLEFARENVPDVDLREVRRHGWQTVLRGTVVATGVTARVADFAGSVSRSIQREASKRIVS